jgi:hypothetical protein
MLFGIAFDTFLGEKNFRLRDRGRFHKAFMRETQYSAQEGDNGK